MNICNLIAIHPADCYCIRRRWSLWDKVGTSALVGGVSGAASSWAGYSASNIKFLVNDISSPILRSAVVSPLAAGAGFTAPLGRTALVLENASLEENYLAKYGLIEDKS